MLSFLDGPIEHTLAAGVKSNDTQLLSSSLQSVHTILDGYRLMSSMGCYPSSYSWAGEHLDSAWLVSTRKGFSEASSPGDQ